ncbi:phage major capsid protein [bacterium]|nr:phage major capsid protein [bacterium]
MDQSLVQKASTIIDEIRTHQRTNTDRLSNVDRQIQDLKTAQKMLTEACEKPITTVTGPEDALSLYVQKDGLQLVSKRKMIQTPNGSTPVSIKGLLDDEPVCEWQQDLQSIVEDRTLLRMMQRSPHTPRTDLKLYKHLLKAPRSIKPAIEKAYSDAAGEGAEFIPDSFLPSMFESFKVRSSLADNFETIRSGIDSKTLLIPRLDKAGTPYLRGVVGDATTLTKTTITSAQASISIPSFATSMRIDTDAMEDSGIPILSALRSAIVSDIRDGFEDCMLNGDTTGAQDTLVSWNIRNRWSGTMGTTSDHRRGFDGLRKEAFDRGTNVATATLSYDDLMTLRYTIGEQGYSDCMIVVSPEILVKYFFAMDELATLDKYGPSAVVLSGQVASVAGMPVVTSRFMGADMNASGVYDNITTDRSGVIIVNRSSYKIYERKALQIQQQEEIEVGAINLVSNYRAIMATADAAATLNVAYQYLV